MGQATQVGKRDRPAPAWGGWKTAWVPEIPWPRGEGAQGWEGNRCEGGGGGSERGSFKPGHAVPSQPFGDTTDAGSAGKIWRGIA